MITVIGGIMENKKTEGQYAGDKKEGVWMHYDRSRKRILVKDENSKFWERGVQTIPNHRLRYELYRSDELVSSLLEKAQTNGYTKVLAKVPRSNSNAFLNAGYRKEAEIPGFYAGKEDALFLCYYLSKNRILECNSAEIEKIYKLSKQKQVARESVIYTAAGCQTHNAKYVKR